MRVKDIKPGTFNLGPMYLSNVNGTLYFASSDRVSSTELWTSDGTDAGTVLVKRFTSGTPSSSISQIIQVNGKLYLVATTQEYGSEIWVADLELPTPAGDYNQNGVVDAADYVLWRKTFGSTTSLQANGDDAGASTGIIDEADYAAWRNNFGNVAWTAGSGDAAPGLAPAEEAGGGSALSAPMVDAVLSALPGKVRYSVSDRAGATFLRQKSTPIVSSIVAEAPSNDVAILLAMAAEEPQHTWPRTSEDGANEPPIDSNSISSLLDRDELFEPWESTAALLVP